MLSDFLKCYELQMGHFFFLGKKHYKKGIIVIQNCPATTIWKGYSYIQNCPATTIRKGYSYIQNCPAATIRKVYSYMQNCLAATIGKGYSLYSKLSGRHYWKGKILLGRPQSVFPFAKGKIPVCFALKSVIFDYMGWVDRHPEWIGKYKSLL